MLKNQQVQIFLAEKQINLLIIINYILIIFKLFVEKRFRNIPIPAFR